MGGRASSAVVAAGGRERPSPDGRRSRAPRRPAGAVVLFARLALAAYVLVPALLTLGPTPLEELRTFSDLLRSAAAALTDGRAAVSFREAEALANVAMFAPLGLLLPLALPRAYLSLLLVVAATASLTIEITQYVVLPDRVPALLDVVMNSAGTAVGLVVGGDARRLLRLTR